MSNRKTLARRQFLQESAAILGTGYLLDGTGISLAASGHASASPQGLPSAPGEGRLTVSLDGIWQIADSVLPDDIPVAYEHTGPVPGMANLATPPFPDVDAYLSAESILDRRDFKMQPESELAKLVPGSKQKRNHLWYRKSFRAPAKKEVAILKINKAQFGTGVWLNGKKIGDHYSCFTAGYFNLTGAMNWEGENLLLVRIGAHPDVVPPGIPTGIDFEKNRWTPGIYDRISLLLSDNPVIETLQVSPRINPREIVVQTKIRNYGGSRSFTLQHQVEEWKSQRHVAESKPQSLSLGAGEERTVTETISLPDAMLWSPENPVLYKLTASTGGDSFSTRFGVREFRFDTATKRAFLNGKVYFMRGSNITLHRFFDDPQCQALPWDETWLRKLLIDIPKHMNWNSFRFCIGPVPDQWLDLADEAGLLIQNEYFVWTLGQGQEKRWSKDELIREYKEWMRDNWNHPSVAIWDATNETVADVFGDEIIPAVRSLDLSDRPWENSWNVPSGPNDPAECHPYLFISTPGQPPKFQMTDLEKMSGAETPADSGVLTTAHARILNEYGWLWLLRDGTPTNVSIEVYNQILGPNATGEQRLELNAYLLAGLTEFWRAHRNFAGVLHFVYLSSNYPGVYTADHFKDIQNLVLDPHFEDYMRQAFKPLGVYINFWQPTLEAGSKHRFFVMMINDQYSEAQGNLRLSLEGEGDTEIFRRDLPFAIPELGQQTYKFDVVIPDAPGKCLLRAAAYRNGEEQQGPTLSRRKVSIVTKS
jgi:beta-galactosidase